MEIADLRQRAAEPRGHTGGAEAPGPVGEDGRCETVRHGLRRRGGRLYGPRVLPRVRRRSRGVRREEVHRQVQLFLDVGARVDLNLGLELLDTAPKPGLGEFAGGRGGDTRVVRLRGLSAAGRFDNRDRARGDVREAWVLLLPPGGVRQVRRDVLGDGLERLADGG